MSTEPDAALRRLGRRAHYARPLFFVDLDLAFFFHARAQVTGKHLHALLALAAHHLFPDLVSLLGEVLIAGFLLFDDCNYGAAGTDVERTADLAFLQIEDAGETSAVSDSQ